MPSREAMGEMRGARSAALCTARDAGGEMGDMGGCFCCSRWRGACEEEGVAAVAAEPGLEGGGVAGPCATALSRGPPTTPASRATYALRYSAHLRRSAVASLTPLPLPLPPRVPPLAAAARASALALLSPCFHPAPSLAHQLYRGPSRAAHRLSRGA